MSRGFGRCQRMILDTLNTAEWMLLWDILPPIHTKAERVTCKRALKRLVAQGLVGTCRIRHRVGWSSAARRLLGVTVVYRPGYEPDAATVYRERVWPVLYAEPARTTNVSVSLGEFSRG